MLSRLRVLVSSEYLLGYTIIGGIVYTNLGDFQHMWKRYRNMLSVKQGQNAVERRVMWNKNGGIVKESDSDVSALHSPTINEVFNSLRTGDLVFIRYDIEKLHWYHRSKLAIIRWLSKNKYYDNVGITYKRGDKTYVLFPTPCFATSKMEETIESITNQKGGVSGLSLVNVQNIITHYCPDTVSVKRLICDKRARQCVDKAILECLEEPGDFKATLFSKSVFYLFNANDSDGKHLFNYIKCSQLLRDSAAFYRDVEESDSKDSGVANSNGASKNSHPRIEETGADKVNMDGFMGVSDNPDPAVPVDLHKACMGILSEFESYVRGREEQLKNTKGQARLITHIYSKAGLIPDFCKLETLKMDQLFSVDWLPSVSGKDSAVSRLSHHVHLFDGNVYKTRFQNMKELSDGDMLWNRT